MLCETGDLVEIRDEIDIRKFKLSLVGDGYLYEEVKNMTDEMAIGILKQRISRHINREYLKSVELIKDVLGKEHLTKEDLLIK